MRAAVAGRSKGGAQREAFYVIISLDPEKSSRSMEGWPMRSCRVVKIVTAGVLVLQLDSAGHMLSASSANARALLSEAAPRT
jgi:hypothetical protein